MDLAQLVLGVDTRQLKAGERDLKQFSGQAEGTARSVDNVGLSFKRMGAALAAAGITTILYDFSKRSVQAAIDAQEMGSAFDVVFGDMAGSVRAWAEETGNALGRSTQEIMRGALAFQELFGKALQPAQAAELSKQFAVLTQDLASFKNLSNEVAQQKLFSGLVGEAEPLRAVGVFLSETAVQAKALELGLGGVTGALTDQEKIIARAALIQEQLVQASGDVARTSGSTANQIKAYEAAVLELQVAIGQKLLPVLTPLITSAANIVNSMAQMAQSFDGAGFGLGRLWSIMQSVIGGWAAYRVTLLAATGAQAAYTSAMVIGTRAIGAAQAATLGLNAALFSNPFTAVAAGVGVLAAAFIGLANAQAQARAETNNLIRSLDAAIKARGADVASKRAEADVERMRAQARLDQVNAERRRLAGPRGLGGGNRALDLEAEQLTWKIIELEGTVRLADRTLKEMGNTTGAIKVPVAQAATAVTGLGGSLRQVGSDARAASDDFQRLYDRLMPYEASVRQIEADALLIRSQKNLTEARKEELLAALEQERFRMRTRGLGEAKVSQGLDPGPLVDAAEEFRKTQEGMARDTEVQTVRIARSFADMTQSITSSLQGLTNSIRSGDFLGILSGVLDIFTQLGSAGVFGSGLQTRLNAPTNRSMGGPVYNGRPYLVGERGPELFTPPGAGRIVSNDNLASRGEKVVVINNSALADVYVDGRIGQAAPVIANAGGQIAMARSAQMQRRRVR